MAPEAAVISADRDLVRRIVENLLDNAYKYSPRSGAIAIEVAGSDGADHPRAVELRIRDQGAGIPVFYRTRIFDEYVSYASTGRIRGPRSCHAMV